MAADLSKPAMALSTLASIDREYTFDEIAIMTRAAPAKLLGLKDRGHLGAGALADVAVYRRGEDIAKMLGSAALVFKNGDLVVQDGAITHYRWGRALRLDPNDINARNSRGAALLLLDRHKEALEMFDALAAQGVEAPVLTLNRGGPVIWLSEKDARSAGIEDNDWVEAFNANGALTARAVVSQRIREGTVFMYHAQEKIVNTPGSEITGQRGGIHNSVTRTVLKPTHMIGGYAQQSYGFNYYGTVGANRDEFVIVRKMRKVDWLEAPVGAKEAGR